MLLSNPVPITQFSLLANLAELEASRFWLARAAYL